MMHVVPRRLAVAGTRRARRGDPPGCPSLDGDFVYFTQAGSQTLTDQATASASSVAGRPPASSSTRPTRLPWCTYNPDATDRPRLVFPGQAATVELLTAVVQFVRRTELTWIVVEPEFWVLCRVSRGAAGTAALF